MPVWSVLLRVVLCLALLFNSAMPAFAHVGMMACHSAAPTSIGKAHGQHATLRPEMMSTAMRAVSHVGMSHDAGMVNGGADCHDSAAMTSPMQSVAVLAVADHSQDGHARHGLAQHGRAADCCDDSGDDRQGKLHGDHDDKSQDPSPHDCDGSDCDVDCAKHCAAAMPLVTAAPAPVLPAAQPQALHATAHRAPPLHHLIRPPIA